MPIAGFRQWISEVESAADAATEGQASGPPHRVENIVSPVPVIGFTLCVHGTMYVHLLRQICCCGWVIEENKFLWITEPASNQS